MTKSQLNCRGFLMYRLAGSGVHKKHNTHQSTSGPLRCTIEAIIRSGTGTHPPARPTGPFSPNVGEEEFSEIEGPEARAVVGWTTVPAPTHQRTRDAARGSRPTTGRIANGRSRHEVSRSATGGSGVGPCSRARDGGGAPALREAWARRGGRTIAR